MRAAAAVLLTLLATCSPSAQKDTKTQPASPRAPHSRTDDDGPLEYEAAHETAPESASQNRFGANSRNITPTPCPDGASYCESMDDYPVDLIQELLKKQPKTLQGHFFHEEADLDVNKFGPEQEDSLCTTERKVAYPTKATAQDGKVEFLVNVGTHKQGIMVEHCKHTGPCNIPGSLSLGYTSHCVQKMITRTLVALDTSSADGSGFITNSFEFPSCCSCAITMDRFANRFGGNLGARSTLPTTPAITTAKAKITKS